MNDYRSGMLSDIDIRKAFNNSIHIFTEYKEGDLAFNLEKQLQPSSIDLHFRNEFKKFKKNFSGNLTRDALLNNQYTDSFSISNKERLVIQPGEIILTSTLETVIITKDYAGLITGRSSIARLGVMVQCCQDFVNPGNGQSIALQLINLSPIPVELDLKTPICQLILFRLTTSASLAYVDKDKSKYVDEKGPLTSKIYLEYSTDRNGRSLKYSNRIKKRLKKYISPFLPSTIMLLAITPLITYAKSYTISGIFEVVLNIPFAYIMVLIAIIFYIWLRKDEN